MDQTAQTKGPDPGIQAGVPPAMEEAPGIGDLFQVFWRRKALLMGAIAFITGLAALIAFQIPPEYSASARLMIHPVKPDGVPARLGGAAASLLGDQRSALYGEIEVMRSDRLIEKTMARLGLADDPEFNPSLRSGVFAALSTLPPVQWLMDALGPADGLSEAGQRQDQRIDSEIIENVRERLNVRPPGLSNVVQIEFDSRDPRKSAEIVNAFTEIYIADRLERRFEANIKSREWLDNRLSGLRETMLESERAAADFQAARKLSAGGRTALADQQFTEANRQLMLAKAELAERTVRFEQVRRIMRAPKGVESIKEVRNSPTIQRLREQEAVVIRRAAELETRFGERHPKMINVRAELANLRARIREEQSRIISELENEIRVAEARVDALQLELDALEETRTTVNRDKVRLNQLLREAAANRNLYEMFLARFKQTNNQESLHDSAVEIISPARIPVAPTSPRKGLIIGLGFLFSIAIGAALVLLLERLDNGFHTMSQIERLLNAVPLGLIPRPAHWRGKSLSELIFQDETSAYVEAVRSIRTSISLTNFDRPPKVILIASALPGEGKTSLAVSIARLAAISALEGRVMLIDCDLRRPSVARELGLKADKGLIHLFSGQAKLEDIVLTDSDSGLHVIPAVTGTPNPPELLNSAHMKGLIEALAQNYDTVILDSPALAAVSDTRVLARLADATVFVVEWEATPRPVALDSFRTLKNSGARIAGVIMQKVNVRKSAAYGYYDEAA
jgi:capsular exopolysaccharide synthesis family protein